MASIVKNIKITPSVGFFGKIIKNGEEYSSIITKAKWQNFKGMDVEGGDSGSLMTSHVSTEWNENNGTVKLQTLVFIDTIKKNHDNTFKVNPCFIKPLDGDIVYSSKENFLIIFHLPNESNENFIGCVFEDGNREILIRQGIEHTLPILYQGDGNINIIHRQTNGFSISQLNTVLEFNTEKRTIDNNLITFIEQSFCKNIDSEKKQVKGDDIDKSKYENANKSLVVGNDKCNIINGGIIVKIDELIEEIPKAVKWENSILENKSKKLSQMFKMSWVNSEETKNLEIKFNGLSGSFEGGEGKPGVIYNDNKKDYSYKLLMTRPDGTFFVRSLTPESGFIMSVAPSSNCGKPDFSRIVNVYVPYGYGIRLNPLTWHSVPFPPKKVSSITLEEVICETNANVVFNLEDSCLSWLSINS
uniref:SH2 domain-containing protein n=1 Tax=Strongyloides stercoralis TaxID=6248 RepID=A0A0K0E651_STRER